MKHLLALGIGLSVAAGAVEEAPRAIQVAEPPAAAGNAGDVTVLSRSGQFRVSGSDAMVRGTVALLAEETKDDLLRLTDEKDEWKVPVALRLHGKAGDPLPARSVAMRLIVVEGVKELRVDIHLGRGIERERFKRALTAALLFERVLAAGAGNEIDAVLVVPPWLSDGLCEASAWRLNQTDRRLYEALFKQGGLFRMEEIFTVDEAEFENLDGASRAAFRVSSGALVMALLEQPQGKEGFRAFLSDAAAFEGEMPSLLRRHFPELNLSETSLAKWWALQLAAKGGLNLVTDILTISQTESALKEALRLHFRTPEGIIQQKDLTAWPELTAIELQERIAAVRPAEDALVRLSYRCFPSYRPLLKEYQLILADIARNRTEKLADRLVALDESRTTMSARAARARDYLDWFEITRARETSGAFDDYQRLKERLKVNPKRRDDGISAYLDSMDRLFHREEAKGPVITPR